MPAIKFGNILGKFAGGTLKCSDCKSLNLKSWEHFRSFGYFISIAVTGIEKSRRVNIRPGRIQSKERGSSAKKKRRKYQRVNFEEHWLRSSYTHITFHCCSFHVIVAPAHNNSDDNECTSGKTVFSDLSDLLYMAKCNWSALLPHTFQGNQRIM